MAINIRAIVDGYTPFKWQYNKSNRLDENIRKAVILRDGGACVECGKSDTRLEVHHIRAKRLGGGDSLSNLVALCKQCHEDTYGKEEEFEDRYRNMIETKNINTTYAQHVMIGKQYLRDSLMQICPTTITYGGDTANRRLDFGIKKSHSNDAIVITNSNIDDVNIRDWILKPIRKKLKATMQYVKNITYRDYVAYKTKDGIVNFGYVVALYPKSSGVSIQTNNKRLNKVSANSCKLLWRFNEFYWLLKEEN